MRTAHRIAAAAVLATWGCIVVHVNDRAEDAGRLVTDVELMRQAMRDMRVLGTAFESFAVDTNRYPVATESDRTVGDMSLSRVETLSKVLNVYARPLPRVDPWDSPYLIWSNGEHYAVICLGADAVSNRPGELATAIGAVANGEDLARTPSHCMEDDLVFANGAFAWWPRDPIRRCAHSAADRD